MCVCDYLYMSTSALVTPFSEERTPHFRRKPSSWAREISAARPSDRVLSPTGGAGHYHGGDGDDDLSA